MATAPSRSSRARRNPLLPLVYLVAAALSATGGARPTGIGWLDGALLALGGVALAACGARARTIPVYVAAGVAAVFQPETGPLVLGCLGLLFALGRRWSPSTSLPGATAGALAWAATVGAPFSSAARPVVLPLLACGWVVASGHRAGSRRFRSRVGLVTVGVGGLFVVGAVLGALAVADARGGVDRGADLLEAGLRSARAGDTEAAVTSLRAARQALGRGEASLGAIWARPAWLVPGVSQNARTLHALVSEVDALAAVAISAADAASLDTLRASGGRIDLAAVAAVEEPVASVQAALGSALARLRELEDAWLLPPVRSGLEDVADELADALPSASLALDGVRLAPELLGAEGPRTYLVLFTSPVEARATTGFAGNFAEITFTDGRFSMTRFGRIRDLDPAPDAPETVVDAPEDFLVRYERFAAHRNFRNLTVSPDFPTVASIAGQLYEQRAGTEVAGVLSVDPVALAALLRFTGPIAVPGVPEPLTADNAAEFLLREQYVSFPDSPERVDLLEALAELTFQRLETVDLPAPRELGEVLGPVVEGKHLQLFAFAEGAPGFLDRLGISGRYPAVEGDFVGVTTSNAAGSKIDLFLQRSLAYDATWDPSTGAVTATATITLTNTAPASGLPPYLIGNALGDRLGEEPMPDGWNNTFLTLYTPFDATSATLDGQPVSLSSQDELGRRALASFVAIGPGETRTLVVELEGVLPDPTYVLDLGAQPMVLPEQASVSVRVAGSGALSVTGPVEAGNGVARGAFELIRDEQITVRRR